MCRWEYIQGHNTSHSVRLDRPQTAGNNSLMFLCVLTFRQAGIQIFQLLLLLQTQVARTTNSPFSPNSPGLLLAESPKHFPTISPQPGISKMSSRSGKKKGMGRNHQMGAPKWQIAWLLICAFANYIRLLWEKCPL